MAFDEFEPIGTRTTPDLLALLVSVTTNLWSGKGARTVLPQDILDSPLYPRRYSPHEEARRIGAVGADYRRLRAERLAAAKQEN